MKGFIEVKNLFFQYEEGEPEKEAAFALNGVDLTIEKGVFVAIVGHNGSGKSTLAKQFNALYLPTTGDVLVDGLNTKDDACLFDIRKKVGLVLQNPDNQIVAGVVEEDVAFGCENLGVPSKEIRQRVDAALKAVDMYDYRKHSPDKLSGGQKQRVAIAGIIAMEPDCIVLDEPTAMLDPQGRDEVIATIRKLNQEKHITIILITHYMEEAVLADRVVVMDSGKVFLEGTPREVFAHTALLKQHRLDVPQATALCDKLKGCGFELPNCVLNEEECVEALVKLLPAPSDTPTKPVQTASAVPSEPSDNRETVLSVEQLKLVYGAGTTLEKTALSDISFSLHSGEFLGIIGHTGSGKSTLVQLMNGLLKPTEGTVYLYGKNIWQEPKKIRSVRFKVGMVFQYPEYQLFEETVYKDIAFGPTNMGLSQEEIDRKVREAAAFVGLKEELLDKSPFDLSGGEKRRAAIAGVMAMDPDVLVLDEPAAGLDPLGRDVLLSEIKAYHAVRKNTIVMVSHSMEDIAKTADRVLVMHQGRMKQLDTTEAVFSHGQELESMGLRVPQITKIMLLLRDRHFSVNTSVLTVEQGFQELLRLLDAKPTDSKGGR